MAVHHKEPKDILVISSPRHLVPSSSRHIFTSSHQFCRLHYEQRKTKDRHYLGDFNGIGPEVVIGALADNRILNMITPVVYGSTRVISFYKKLMNLEEFNYSQQKQKGQLFPKTINVVNCWDDNTNIEITPGKASKESGTAARIALEKVVEEAREGLIDGFVTGPIDKYTIHSEQFPFRGHTEYLTKTFNATESLMMLAGSNLKVGLVTEHIPVKEIAQYLTRERVELKIRLMELSLKKDFNIQKPRIAVLGLNPHAGDEGLIGEEEINIIKPVIADLKSKGKLIFGPFPADGFFGSGAYAKYDGTIAHVPRPGPYSI
ncbi:MAG: 4-hydroxythreonine-4-phosphate dehydrogenase PdxA [Bacteroidota bacterium]